MAWHVEAEKLDAEELLLRGPSLRRTIEGAA